ncbi:pyruvate dehydrogenase E1 component alpha subunit [Bryocella elongata]|uniref:Pyruvate dehydrogenase E1 component alpha subunit n=1 Tax=Bryocella elongata TaxID=863522 RepID=A0A1H5Z7L2_9BACT|nr:thiamine pyrophosphate-dependent enzyme [Bryocella elongata]SEG32262.1 pyruvate dehydrogenase E1 component alpha subunit [Bryocella elongata]
MAENPLLPHRKLQELRALMLRLRALDGRTTKGPRLEALKAATIMHLEAGDYAAAPGTEAALPSATTKAPKKTTKAESKKAVPLPAKPTRERIATAAGIAQGFKLAKLDRAAIVFTEAGSNSETAWAEALDYAMRAELALIVLCIDTTDGKPSATPGALDWPAAEKLSARSKVPIVSVDGEDAVALYRVMQESMIHVRLGAGPILVWALCSPNKLKAAEQPIQRLEDYMSVRSIPLER